MKKLFSLITIFSALLILSCSNFNSTTSVKITLNAGNARSAARDIEPDNKEAGYYIVASINGGHKEAQTQFLSWEDEECTFTFENVPVGKEIYAELNAYWASSVEMNDNPNIQLEMPYRDSIHEYTGRSETITVTTGENFLPLELNSFDARYEDGQEWREPIHLDGKTSDGIPVSLELQMTGKYVLRGCTDNFYCVCSEGTWRSDEPINNETIYKEGSRTIYLTEYVYGKENTQKYPTGYEEKYTTPVIVEMPQENAVTVKNGEKEKCRFTFTSKSGKTFTFGEDNAGGGNDEPVFCNLKILDSDNGTVSSSPLSPIEAGTKVTLTINPAEGYKMSSCVAKTQSGEIIRFEEYEGRTCTFTMPSEDVIVSTEFVEERTVLYNLTISDSDNGTVSSSPQSPIEAGTQVTLTINPAEGYKMSSCVAQTQSGLVIEFEKYTERICTFTMPSSNVAISVIFVKDAPEGFVYVEGRTFYDNDDISPASEVLTVGTTIPNLYVCDHEVTQQEYEKYCFYGDTSNSPSESLGIGNNYPAYYVSWYDAIVYCNLRSMAERLTPVYELNGETDPTKWNGIRNIGDESNMKYCGPDNSNDAWNTGITCNPDADGYRLPTEAEWEYAARGGPDLKNYLYSGSDDIAEVAWFVHNIGSEGGCKEVKTKEKPNSLEIYDMSGNVNEWCWEPFISSTNFYNAYYRGGSYMNTYDYCQVQSRTYTYDLLEKRDPSIGFRVVRNAD